VPPPLLERLALEFFGLLVPVLFVVIVFGPGQANDLELPAQHPDRRLDRACTERTQRHESQQIDKLELIHLAWRFRIDQHVHVRRSFEQLRAPRSC
jgi:hypothetical protein